MEGHQFLDGELLDRNERYRNLCEERRKGVSRESPKTHTAMGSSNEKWKEGNEKAVRNVMAAKEAESKAKQKGKKEQKILFRW